MRSRSCRSLSPIVIPFLIGLMSLRLVIGAEFYVSPTGDDDNSGTQGQAFFSLHRAQQAARLIKDESVRVILKAGVYELEKPLLFTPEDSRSKDHPMVWQAEDGAEVVISGGKIITHKWSRGDGGVWRVDLTLPSNANFRQLFVNGKRAIRARYPNANEGNPLLYATGGGRDHVLIDPSLVKKSWGTETDAQINLVPQWKFFNQWNTITAVDMEKGRIDIADSERHAKVTPGNWFWIEGVKEELDAPNEWYFDRDQSRLFYLPEQGVDPNGLEFVVPCLDRLIELKGDVEEGTHIEYIHFSGLKFRHTTFTLGHIEARVHTDAAIRLENAKHCSIEDCRIENIGGYAFWLHLDSQHNQICGNTVLHSGGGGVLFTGARFSYMDDSKLYTPGKKAAEAFPILNRVSHNTVKHCGKIRYYGGGVHLDSRPASMAMAPGNYIGHNEFADLSRNGVFAFRNQGGNVVEYNHIYDAMQTTIDGACIHFATMNHLNAPNYILNNWLHDIWGYEQLPSGKPKRHLANGVFLDWATSNTTVRDNWIYNAGGKPIKNIMGNWNLVIENNQTSQKKITPGFSEEVGPQGTATNGIDLEGTRRIGSVVHYSNQELVSYQGDWQPREIDGFWNLFSFQLLESKSKTPSKICYKLPIQQDGRYQISLLYLPDPKNASNAKLSVHHADGVSELKWNMKKGDKYGFAVEVGEYRFEKGTPAQVVISNEGADGVVVADSVAFVRVGEH